MSLRVEGGEARGRRLRAPRQVRPTQGLVKGVIFNMLGPRVLEARVLDLYAGSGGLGIEALSRGAAGATFVERSGEGAQAIRENLAATGYGERAEVVRAPVLRWLREHPAEVGEADLVLADPPYADPELDAVLAVLDASLGVGATLVVEHASGRALPALARLVTDRTRRHGGTSVTIARVAG